MFRTPQLVACGFVLLGLAVPATAQPPGALSPQQQQLIQQIQQQQRYPWMQAPAYQYRPQYNGPQFAPAPTYVPRQPPQPQFSVQGCVNGGPWQACCGTNGCSVSRGNGFSVGGSRDANGQADFNVSRSWTGPSIIAPTGSVGYSLRNNSLQACGGVDVGLLNPLDPTQRLLSVSGQLCAEGSLNNRQSSGSSGYRNPGQGNTAPSDAGSSPLPADQGNQAPLNLTTYGYDESSVSMNPGNARQSGSSSSDTIIFDDNASMNPAPITPRQSGQSAATAAAHW